MAKMVGGEKPRKIIGLSLMLISSGSFIVVVFNVFQLGDKLPMDGNVFINLVALFALVGGYCYFYKGMKTKKK